MKRFLTTAFAFSLLALPTVFAQSFTDAKALLQASLDKNGGAKVAEIKTLKKEGTLTIMGTPIGDLDGTIVEHFQFPGYSKQAQTIGTPMGAMEITNVVTPEKAWSDNSMAGRQELPKDRLGKITSVSEERELLDEAELKIELKDGETFNGKAVYALAYEKNKAQITRFYDKETLLCLGFKGVREEGESTQTYTSYADVNGVKVANAITIEQKGGDQELTIKVKYEKIEANVTLPADMFSDK